MTRNITITPVLNGFIVNAACQTIVFDSTSKLCSEIKRYLDNPKDVEKEYIEKRINDTMDNYPRPAAECAQVNRSVPTCPTPVGIGEPVRNR